MSEIAKFAEAYIRRYGIAVVQIEPGTKGPRGTGWNKPGGYFTDADAAGNFFSKHDNWNMGAVLGPSGLCSLDVDNVDAARTVLASYGISVDELADSFPTIVGNPARFRVSFRVPAGIELARKSLTWPNEKDPDGSKHADLIRQAIQAKKAGELEIAASLRDEAKQYSRMTVIEFRAGDVQDVLPPSIHPGTGKPYIWRTKPNGHFPELPSEILDLWQDWDGLRAKAETLCPWRPKQTKRPATEKQRTAASRDGMGVIESYNASQSIETALDAYGYDRHGDRWLSPHSSTGDPGIWIQKPHNRAWNEHASDPLCSTNNGRPVSPFDLFCYYDHGGDVKKAVKAAANILGMALAPARRDPPSPPPPNVDIETGEIIEPSRNAPPTELSVGEMLSIGNAIGLKMNNSGVPVPSLTNAVRCLEELPELKGLFWYDEFLQRIMTTFGERGTRPWTDADDINLTLYLQRRVGADKLSRQMVSDAVIATAMRNIRNECREWIESHQWDGTDRIDYFLHDVFDADDSDYVRAASKNFWLSMVARVMRPGCKVDNMLVLEGGQGIGKSSALAAIASPWFAEANGDPHNKDFMINLQGKLLIEIGEMDSFSRADVTKVKQIITSQFDRFRVPHGKHAQDFPRQGIFAGTTNRDDWQRDETGGRRFWPITCRTVKNELITQNRAQYFAEALHRCRSGETWWEMPVEVTAEQQESRRQHDAWEPVVSSWLVGRNQTTIGEVLLNALEIPKERWDRITQNRVGVIMRILGWEKTTFRDGGRVIKGMRRI